MDKSNPRRSLILKLAKEELAHCPAIFDQLCAEFESDSPVARRMVNSIHPGMIPLAQRPEETGVSMNTIETGVRGKIGAWARSQPDFKEVGQPPVSSTAAGGDQGQRIGTDKTPVTPPSISTAALSDPERRLARLREVGGSSKYHNYGWKFKGLNNLVKIEKEDGKKRSDPKTIRKDLTEAAQAERDAKTAQPFAGLTQ